VGHARARARAKVFDGARTGSATPTRRVYAHAMREEETDLSFADFAGQGADEAATEGGSERLYPAPASDEADDPAVCLARDRLHSVPETWFTQLAFGESPDAVESV